jgi:hypothetical protein
MVKPKRAKGSLLYGAVNLVDNQNQWHLSGGGKFIIV